MKDTLQTLIQSLDRGLLKKKDTNRVSSIAYSKSGKQYAAGKITFDTGVLDSSSELIALALSAQYNDYGVNKIVTLTENPEEGRTVSPVVLKTIIDHTVRTGMPIEYMIIDIEGNELFYSENISKTFSYYNPPISILSKVKENREITENKATFNLDKDSAKDILKKYALLGLERSFTTYDSASGYSAAVLTKNGTIYFSGLYSSFGGNTGLHSEMTAILSALMDGNKDITHLGLLSTRNPDTPCNLCGCCRQFAAEVVNRLDLNLKIFCFAKDNDEYEKHTIEKYLPSQWTSKK